MKQYTNGNRVVVVGDNGYKFRLVREGQESTPYVPEFPETIDINLSNRCAHNCSFCYLDATPEGGEASIRDLIGWRFLPKLFRGLPKGVEVAINYNGIGVAAFLFLRAVREFNLNFTVNVTVKYTKETLTIMKMWWDLGYFNALGVSVTNAHQIQQVEEMKGDMPVVYHLINGVHSIPQITREFKNLNFLILGYKKLGRGVGVAPRLLSKNEWLSVIESAKNNQHIISVDTLGYFQQKEADVVLPKPITQYGFVGDEVASMYLDLVKKEYGKSSALPERFKIQNRQTIIEMFANLKKL